MLGLPPGVRACLFDVEGVLTNGAELCTPGLGVRSSTTFCLSLSAQTGWHFIPFDRIGDYRAFFDGRARLEGIRAFLASRGIRLPEGQTRTTPARRIPRTAWPGEKASCSRTECVRAAWSRSPALSLPPGRRTCRPRSAPLSQRAPARCRCWNSPGSRRWSRSVSTQMRSAPKGCARVPRRICCWPHAAASAFAQKRRSPSHIPRPGSLRGTRLGLQSSASATKPRPSPTGLRSGVRRSLPEHAARSPADRKPLELSCGIGVDCSRALRELQLSLLTISVPVWSLPSVPLALCRP